MWSQRLSGRGDAPSHSRACDFRRSGSQEATQGRGLSSALNQSVRRGGTDLHGQRQVCQTRGRRRRGLSCSLSFRRGHVREQVYGHTREALFFHRLERQMAAVRTKHARSAAWPTAHEDEPMPRVVAQNRSAFSMDPASTWLMIVLHSQPSR